MSSLNVLLLDRVSTGEAGKTPDVQLSERLSCLSAVWGPLKPFRSSHHYRFEGFNWGLLICPPLCRETLVYLAHGENYISISFHIKWNMIVVTVFLPNLNQI